MNKKPPPPDSRSAAEPAAEQVAEPAAQKEAQRDAPQRDAVASSGREGADGKLLRIGQLAERCGKTVRALHLYEEMGLLKPVLRTPGGFRLYSVGAVERVQWINRLQEADVSLGEIQTLLRDLEEQRIGPEAMTRLRELLARKLGEIREQRARLEQLESDITAGLHYLDGCRTCGPEHKTTECGGCRLHGHDGNQPLMVAGAHQS